MAKHRHRRGVLLRPEQSDRHEHAADTPQLFTLNKVVTDDSGQATFTVIASSTDPSQQYLGGADGAARLIAVQLDLSTGSVDNPQSVNFVKFDTGDVFAQTPELDSLLLLGSGGLGLAGYTLLRIRARRRD